MKVKRVSVGSTVRVRKNSKSGGQSTQSAPAEASPSHQWPAPGCSWVCTSMVNILAAAVRERISRMGTLSSAVPWMP